MYLQDFLVVYQLFEFKLELNNVIETNKKVKSKPFDGGFQNGNYFKFLLKLYVNLYNKGTAGGGGGGRGW